MAQQNLKNKKKKESTVFIAKLLQEKHITILDGIFLFLTPSRNIQYALSKGNLTGVCFQQFNFISKYVGLTFSLAKFFSQFFTKLI